MPGPPNDDRPALVVAMQWVSQITTVSLVMALPAGLGYWLDVKWGTRPWLVSCGAMLGLIIGMRHLLQMVGVTNKKNEHNEDS